MNPGTAPKIIVLFLPQLSAKYPNGISKITMEAAKAASGMKIRCRVAYRSFAYIH